MVPVLGLAAAAPFATGDEVRVRLRVERYASPLDLERWSGERLQAGPTEASADAFLFYVP